MKTLIERIYYRLLDMRMCQDTNVVWIIEGLSTIDGLTTVIDVFSDILKIWWYDYKIDNVIYYTIMIEVKDKTRLNEAILWCKLVK